MDKSGKAMEKIGRRTETLLSQQVSGTRYFFVDLAPSPRELLAVALGGRERCNPDYVVRRDRYAYHVLEIVVEGEGSVMLGRQRHRLAPGSVYVAGPRMRCEIRTDPGRPLVKYFLCASGAACARRFARAGVRPGVVRRVAAVADLASVADDLIREGQHAGPQARDICRHLLEVLLLKIEAQARRPGAPEEPARQRFLRCKALIDAEAERLMSLREIAGRAGLEQSSLCRLFRRYQGTSPYQYLLRRKMAAAAAHLLERGTLVKEAAQRVGFTDPFHFSRVFKAVHGVPPTHLGRLGAPPRRVSAARP